MAALPQTLFNRTQKGASSVAQRIAKGAVSEVKETIKNAESQLRANGEMGKAVPESSPQMPGIVQEIREQGPTIDVEQIHAEDREKIRQLEAKLMALREKSQQQLHTYNQTVSNEMKAMNRVEEAPIVEASTKKKGPGVMGKVKQTVSNLLSRKQGERKAGSGKG